MSFRRPANPSTSLGVTKCGPESDCFWRRQCAYVKSDFENYRKQIKTESESAILHREAQMKEIKDKAAVEKFNLDNDNLRLSRKLGSAQIENKSLRDELEACRRSAEEEHTKANNQLKQMRDRCSTLELTVLEQEGTIRDLTTKLSSTSARNHNLEKDLKFNSEEKRRLIQSHDTFIKNLKLEYQRLLEQTEKNLNNVVTSCDVKTTAATVAESGFKQQLRLMKETLAEHQTLSQRREDAYREKDKRALELFQEVMVKSKATLMEVQQELVVAIQRNIQLEEQSMEACKAIQGITEELDLHQSTIDHLCAQATEALRGSDTQSDFSDGIFDDDDSGDDDDHHHEGDQNLRLQITKNLKSQQETVRNVLNKVIKYKARTSGKDRQLRLRLANLEKTGANDKMQRLLELDNAYEKIKTYKKLICKLRAQRHRASNASDSTSRSRRSEIQKSISVEPASEFTSSTLGFDMPQNTPVSSIPSSTRKLEVHKNVPNQPGSEYTSSTRRSGIPKNIFVRQPVTRPGPVSAIVPCRNIEYAEYSSTDISTFPTTNVVQESSAVLTSTHEFKGKLHQAEGVVTTIEKSDVDSGTTSAKSVDVKPPRVL